MAAALWWCRQPIIDKVGLKRFNDVRHFLHSSQAYLSLCPYTLLLSPPPLPMISTL